MSPFDEKDIEYGFVVSVQRPVNTNNEDGDTVQEFVTVAEGLKADIQFQQVPKSMSKELYPRWRMFCSSEVPLMAGDRVTEGERTFEIEVAADWGSHLECVMKEK